MFTPPRIVPHELEQAPAEPATTTRELDMEQYGYCYEPRGYMRVAHVSEFDPDTNEGEQPKEY